MSTLTIWEALVNDGGVYTCKPGSNIRSEANVTLSVVESEKEEGRRGASLLLLC